MHICEQKKQRRVKSAAPLLLVRVLDSKAVIVRIFANLSMSRVVGCNVQKKIVCWLIVVPVNLIEFIDCADVQGLSMGHTDQY